MREKNAEKNESCFSFLFLSVCRSLTGEELEHRGCHGNGGGDVGELDDEGGEELDHDVGHLHRAHCEGHHALLGTAVNEAGLQALNQLSL